MSTTKQAMIIKEKQLFLQDWVYQNALIMVLSFLIFIFTKFVFIIIGGSFLAFFLFYHRFHSKFSIKELYSTANFITAFRWLMISFTAFNVDYFSPMVLFFCFSIPIILDGIDGLVARKYQESSEVGALLDKITDAFLVLVMTVLIIERFHMPYWLVLIGLLHYGYEILLYTLGWQQLSIPQNPIGKFSAVVLFISLLGAFILPQKIIQFVLPFAALLTFASFGLSFFSKWRAFKSHV